MKTILQKLKNINTDIARLNEQKRKILNKYEEPKWVKQDFNPGSTSTRCKWKSHGGGIVSANYELTVMWIEEHSQYHKKGVKK